MPQCAMLYMVIERYRDPAAVYRRLREEGRGLPKGLRYLHSWVTPNLERCYQVMETEDRQLLEEWLASWSRNCSRVCFRKRSQQMTNTQSEIDRIKAAVIEQLEQLGAQQQKLIHALGRLQEDPRAVTDLRDVRVIRLGTAVKRQTS